MFRCCTFSHFYSKLGHNVSQHIVTSNRKHSRGRSKNPPFASSNRAFFMGQKLIACDNYHWPLLQGSLWAKTFLQCVDINQSWSKRCEPESVHVQWRWMTNATFTKSDTSGMLFPGWNAAHWLGLFYGETAMIDTGSLQLSTQRSQSGRASVPLRNAKGKKKSWTNIFQHSWFVLVHWPRAPQR